MDDELEYRQGPPAIMPSNPDDLKLIGELRKQVERERSVLLHYHLDTFGRASDRACRCDQSAANRTISIFERMAKAEAEVLKLKEPMICGHPIACEYERRYHTQETGLCSEKKCLACDSVGVEREYRQKRLQEAESRMKLLERVREEASDILCILKSGSYRPGADSIRLLEEALAAVKETE